MQRKKARLTLNEANMSEVGNAMSGRRKRWRQKKIPLDKVTTTTSLNFIIGINCHSMRHNEL